MMSLQPAHRSPRENLPGLPTRLPRARGPITEQLLDHLLHRPHEISPLPLAAEPDPLHDDDAALALYLFYEQHYLGLPGVDEGWEWNPSLLRERHRLEEAFADQVVDLVGPAPIALSRDEVKRELTRLSTDGSGPSLSGYMERSGTIEQLRELAIHRSAYQLKEADPHTWAIPRLTGRPKAALVEIQRGEYGDGVVEEVHANLFAAVLQELRLDASYGAYVDRLPALTLATCNLVSMFGLHRRWRGALVGHLALFEMCSVGPMGRYASAVRRLGHGDPAARFYEAHVVADERHQVVALDDMVDGLVTDEPLLGGDVVFGARALAGLERLFAALLLDAWEAGRSSLRPPP